MAAASTKKAKKPAAKAPEKAPDAKTDKPETKPEAPKSGADELVKSPAEQPTPVRVNENFARTEKVNSVYVVTFYNDGAYGEFALEDVSGMIQKGSIMSVFFQNNPNAIELDVTAAEADELFSKWRSLRQSRRNA